MSLSISQMEGRGVDCRSRRKTRDLFPQPAESGLSWGSLTRQAIWRMETGGKEEAGLGDRTGFHSASNPTTEEWWRAQRRRERPSSDSTGETQWVSKLERNPFGFESDFDFDCNMVDEHLHAERDVLGLARTERVCIGFDLGVSVTEDPTRRILVGKGYLTAISYRPQAPIDLVWGVRSIANQLKGFRL